MEIKVSIRWNEIRQQWDMYDGEGHFIQEFFPCKNFSRVFKGVKKDDDIRDFNIKVTR